MNDTTRRDPSADLPATGWGLPGAPAPRTGAEPGPGAGTSWRQVRSVVSWAVLALGAPWAGFGLVLVLDDLAETTDAWHGFGMAIGALIGVPALVVALLAGLLLRAQRRGRRDEAYAVTLGAVLLLMTLFATLTPVALVPGVAGGLLVASVVAQRRGAPAA